MVGIKEFYNGIKAGFMEFGQLISLLVNGVLLFLVYILGIGITSLFAKLTGKKFFFRELKKESSSYWEDLDLKKESIEKYYRQF